MNAFFLFLQKLYFVGRSDTFSDFNDFNDNNDTVVTDFGFDVSLMMRMMIINIARSLSMKMMMMNMTRSLMIMM